LTSSSRGGGCDEGDGEGEKQALNHLGM